MSATFSWTAARRRRAFATSLDALTLAMVVVLILVMFVAMVATLGPRAGGLDAHLPLVLVVMVTIVAAEQVRLRLPGRGETSPLVTAVGLGMAFAWDQPDGPLGYTAGGCILAVGLAIAVGVIPRKLGRPGDPLADALDTSVRLFSIVVAAILWRSPWPWLPSVSFMSLSASWPQWQRACLILLVAILAVLFEAPITAARRAAQQRMGWIRATRDEARLTMGLSLSVAVTGTMIAVCLPVLGLLAVPLMILPMFFTQNAVRRQTAIRQTYRQTVRALSIMPEVVGIIPRGHASEVARLSVGVARRLGMNERDVNDLEFAALLHDIGQVTLRYPIPGGATVQAAPVDQQRIADDGAAIVRETGVLGSVADIVATQATPYRRVVESLERLPMSGRILKVTNAYADYHRAHVEAGGTDEHCRAAAMERIYLGLGYQFDPVVVAALEHVLDQDG